MTAPRLEDLAQIEDAVWRELAACVRDKAHAWHLAVLATTDGDSADARTVVLRECQPAQRTLLMFTDARSPKARQIEAHPLGTLVLWSAALGWQLRLHVRLRLDTAGPQVSSHWARLQLTAAAQDYMSPLPPGSPLTEVVPTRESRGHFAVLTAQVLAADWLELHPQGHRRAVWDAGGARWVTP